MKQPAIRMEGSIQQPKAAIKIKNRRASFLFLAIRVRLSVLTVFTRANLILVSLCNIVVVVVIVVFVVCFDSYQIINESQEQQIGSGY